MVRLAQKEPKVIQAVLAPKVLSVCKAQLVLAASQGQPAPKAKWVIPEWKDSPASQASPGPQVTKVKLDLPVYRETEDHRELWDHKAPKAKKVTPAPSA